MVYVTIGSKGPGSLFIRCDEFVSGHLCKEGVTEVCDFHFEELEEIALTYPDRDTLAVSRGKPKGMLETAEAKVPESRSTPPKSKAPSRAPSRAKEKKAPETVPPKGKEKKAEDTSKVKALTTEALKGDEKKGEPIPAPESFGKEGK